MIGHQQIIESRRQRRKPASIFFEIGAPVRPEFVACGPARAALRDAIYNPESAMKSGLFPVVYVAEDETPDLRFARGCNAHISGPRCTAKLIELGHALADAGASMVIISAIAETSELMIFADGEWRTE